MKCSEFKEHPDGHFEAMRAIPGKHFADISAGRLEYSASGEGRPVVVFINGGGPANMDSWRKVYPAIATLTAVIAYNRFGDGASDQVSVPQTGSRIILALRELLEQTSLRPPYVLVAHSIGGLYSNLFARLYPQEVAGVVFVDSSHPDQGEMMRERRGLLGAMNRLFFKFYSKSNPSKASEITSFEETAEEIRGAGTFPYIPVTVVTAGKRATFGAAPETIEIIERHQKELSEMSPRGRQVIAGRSGHYIQNAEFQIVIDAIQAIVQRRNV